jgi:hypothetical protein
MDPSLRFYVDGLGFRMTNQWMHDGKLTRRLRPALRESDHGTGGNGVRRSRKVIFALLLAAFASPVCAQVPDTGYARRALTRLSEKLGADATLPDSLRRLTVAELAGATNTGHAGLLDDSSSAFWVRTMATTLRQLPDSVCGALLGAARGDASDLDGMLPYVDAGTVDRWAIILERVVRARAVGVPGGRVATETEFRAALLGIPAKLSAADRQRVVATAHNPPPSEGDMCWWTRVMMDGIADLPMAELGPVARAMFGGARPAQSP